MQKKKKKLFKTHLEYVLKRYITKKCVKKKKINLMKSVA